MNNLLRKQVEQKRSNWFHLINKKEKKIDEEWIEALLKKYIKSTIRFAWEEIKKP